MTLIVQPPPPKGLSSTGDLARSQVGTAKLGGESLLSSPAPHKLPRPLLFLLPIIPSIFFVLYSIFSPSPEPISPLAYPSAAPVVRQSLTSSSQMPLSYYLAASQEYLSNARNISLTKGQSQTPQDKKEIIDFLNQSLKMANNAVLYYPDNPQSYLTRAELFDNLAALDPSMKQKAETDRTLASRLGGGEKIEINPQDLITTSPIEQASLNQNVAIAFPEEEKAKDVITDKKDNTHKDIATIKTGEVSITIHPEELTPDQLVYFTPQENLSSSILTLSNKTTCKQGSELSGSSEPCSPSFTLSLDSPLDHDLSIDWWIIK